MVNEILKDELCEVYLDIMSLKMLAEFMYKNVDETVDKDFFRVYERTLETVSKKLEKYMD
jgi:hypothetical protein